jgi:hypothetical protein
MVPYKKILKAFEEVQKLTRCINSGRLWTTGTIVDDYEKAQSLSAGLILEIEVRSVVRKKCEAKVLIEYFPDSEVYGVGIRDFIDSKDSKAPRTYGIVQETIDSCGSYRTAQEVADFIDSNRG